MFRPLTRDNLSHIIDNLVAALRSRLADRTLNLEMTDAAKALIIENGYDPVYGARPLKRYLQSHAETLIARTIPPATCTPATRSSWTPKTARSSAA